MADVNYLLKQLFTFLVVLLLISTPLSARAVNSIKINTYTDYPPYLYHDEDQYTGLYMRIVELTFKAINQPFTVNILPFKRSIYETAAGDGIAIGILKTELRKQTLDFSEPFYQERVSVFYNQQQTPLIKTVDKLDGLTIGTLLGWSYGTVFDNAKAKKRFFTHDGKLETNLYWLSKGKLDAVIHSELSAFYVLNKLGLKGDVFLATEPLALADIRIAVKKGTQKDLLVKFNQKLKEPAHLEKINALIESYKQ